MEGLAEYSRYVLLCQSFYFGITGLWPLFSIATFERVTGPKTDHWLVQTVGVLITASAIVFFVSVLRGDMGISVQLLALANALGLLTVDCVFVAKGVIPRIYLADALVEMGFVLYWIAHLSTSPVV